MKKKKVTFNDGTCVFIDEVGAIKLRPFKIIGEKEGKVKIDFGNDETYIVKKAHIRAKRFMMYRTADGKISVQNPNNWEKIDLKKHGIKQLRFNLQNFAIQEGRASIHRWTLPKDKIEKLTPLFKMLMIAIAMGMMGWACLKFGTYVLDVVMNSRTLDCASVMPKVPSPLGAIVEAVNSSAPLGA